ncbi:MAG: septum formation protein Maf, partial [Ignavibacteriales bacterium]|nr:septum formation protein Maf [Ignavibacteriales bacterium]
GIDEKIHDNLSYADNVMQLSLHKAQDIAGRNSNGIVIGSDTIVVINKKILNKPATKDEAFEMLTGLSGKTHSVFTGFALVDVKSKKFYIDYETTEVTFRRLSDGEITDYIDTGSPMDKAGAYGIQDDFGAVFVEKINGCYYTVVGFPLAKFYTAFTRFVTDLGYLKGIV